MNELIRASWVIGRRDFVAVIFSKAFFFFLLGPIFPLAIGIAAGSIGGQVSRDIDTPYFAVVMPASDRAAVMDARKALAARLGERRLPMLVAEDLPGRAEPAEIEALLSGDNSNALHQDFVAALTGTLANPVMTGPQSQIDRWRGEIELLLESARRGDSSVAPPPLETRIIAQSSGEREQSRLVTAQAGQALLVLLTMLLAGMALSNLVEEKTNKIIEILAAAIPIDAIFLGKLLAMLGMAMFGIMAWGMLVFMAVQLFAQGGGGALPPPAVGWAMFIALGVVYFAMAYLLLGSVFLGIGAMASTVREVQTLSMPATMAQLLVFFLAAFAVTRIGEPIELFAAIFPFSSPFAMLARAAQQSAIWPHLLAIGWQFLWVLLFIRIGARIFRRNVLKSGQANIPVWRRLAGAFSRPA